MIRPLLFLVGLLAITGAAAQVPIAGSGAGAPIAVPPVQIGRPADGAAIDGKPARAENRTAQPAVPQSSPPPVPMGTCNAGGCWDSQGNRYNSTGEGSRLVSPEGRPCQSVGKFIHCN